MTLRRRALIGAAAAALPGVAFGAPCGEQERRKLLRFGELLIPDALACSGGLISPPAPAAALGYTKLLFGDDFTAASTVASSPNTTSGVNWFLASNATSANAVVHGSTTASQIANGNSGGGSFASPVGGVLTINGPNAPGNGNVTIFTIPASQQKTTDPGFGCWGPNVYMEVYAQFNVACTANNQWFAPLWFFSQVLSGGNHGQEVDVIENFCGNFGFNANNSTFAGHEWVGATNTNNAGGSFGTGLGANWKQIVTDSNWHAWGFSWVATSATTGTLQVFYDNQPVVLFNNNTGAPYGSSVLSVGTGGTSGFAYLLTGFPLMAIMGGPPGWDMNIDYFRVWAAPPLFFDDFTTLSLYNTRNPAAGGTWQPAGTFSTFVDGQDFSGVWAVNPFNPATPYNNIYTAANGILSLRMDNSPDSTKTGGDTLVGAQLHTFNTFQHSVQGYWEIRVAVQALKGSNFAFWLSDQTGKQQIAIFGGENAQDGSQFGNFNVWDPATQTEVFSWFTFQQPNQALNNISNFHRWGLKITSTTVTNYIDRMPFVTTPLPAGYVNPMFMFLDWFTDGSNGAIAKPLSQPWFSQIDYVAYFLPQNSPV